MGDSLISKFKDFQFYCVKINIEQNFIVIKNIVAILVHYKVTFYPNFAFLITLNPVSIDISDDDDNSISLVNTCNVNNIEPYKPLWSPIQVTVNNPFSDDSTTIRNNFWDLLEGFNIKKDTEIKSINEKTFIERKLQMKIKVLISRMKTSR